MGMLILAACHSCHEYIDLNKFQTLFYLTGKALKFKFKDSDGNYDTNQLYYALDVDDLRYQLFHAHRLLRFIALHDNCDTKIDLIQAGGDDELDYDYVINNYYEIGFQKDMNDAPWEPIWHRSHENKAYIDDMRKNSKV